MRKTSKAILQILMFSIIMGIFNICLASQPTVDWGFKWELEPKDLPDSAGPIELLFSFTPTESCPDIIKEVNLTVTTSDNLKYIGTSSWVVSVDKGNTYSTVLNLILPENDTSRIYIKMDYGNGHINIRRYFVTTGELVEFWKGYPSGRYWKYPKFEPDTNKYEIRIDLRNNGIRNRSSLMELFEEEYGKPEETPDTGIFILRLPRGGLEHLKSAGFKCEYITEPPPKKPGPPGAKGKLEKRNKPSNNPYPKKTNKDPSGEVWIDQIDFRGRQTSSSAPLLLFQPLKLLINFNQTSPCCQPID